MHNLSLRRLWITGQDALAGLGVLGGKLAGGAERIFMALPLRKDSDTRE